MVVCLRLPFFFLLETQHNLALRMRWVRDLAAQRHNPQYDPPVAPPINRLSVANQKNRWTSPLV